MRPCPIVPKKECLVKAILQRFTEIGWAPSFTGWTLEVGCQANKEWLVNILSTVDPNHRFF